MNSTYFANLDPDVYKTIVFFLLLVIVMRFILIITNKYLDQKLKNKMIDKGMTNDLVTSLLQTDQKDQATNSIKWFLILCSTGIGLFITERFLPLGIHSFAIMSISISIGFLAFSYYIKFYKK